MGAFSSFALSFSFVSITTGIFGNYSFGIQQGGPRFIWTWILVGIGQTLVALCLAQMAVRVPLAGAMYNWGSRLIGPRYGWFSGWFTLAGYMAGYAGVAYAFSAYFAPYFGIGTSTRTIVITTVILIVVVATINIVGMKLASHVNNVSVVTEIIGITVLGIGFLIYSLVHGHTHVGLTSNVGLAGSRLGHTHFGGFASSILMGAYTLIGFECAADLSEETKGAVRSVPRAIIYSIVISAVLGFFVILGFTLAIPSLPAVVNSGTPLLVIMQHYLGSVLTHIAMVMVFISIFACTLMNTATPARQMYALARDNMLPAGGFLTRVTKGSHSPYASIVVVSVIAIAFTVVAKVEAVITSVSSVAIYVGYGLVIIAGLVNRKRLPSLDPNGFSLGRWHRPVAFAALTWLVVAIAALTIPAVGHKAAVAFLVVAGIAVAWYLVRIRRMHFGAIEGEEEVAAAPLGGEIGVG
ncbi:MAG TPA: amino acid permease [Solirubrobacteraceae bacterium]|nr:amino acid permease [Solirubrobacteraceae bacterium]